MENLYKALARVEGETYNRIQRMISQGRSLKDLLDLVETQTDTLNGVVPSLTDAGGCQPGSHWDAALGECVPN